MGIARGLGLGVAAIALTLGIAGCSGSSDGSKSGDSPSATSTSSAQKLLDKALKEHAQGDLATAKKDYTQVLDSDPRNKYALYNLGVIAQTEGDDPGAVKRYQQALTVDPGYNPAL